MRFVFTRLVVVLWATKVDVAAFVKHWILDPTVTRSPMVILEFTRIRLVVDKELCINIVLAVVNVPSGPRFRLLRTFMGPTIFAEDRMEAP